MNRFSFWKYGLILFVLGIGIIYSLPNLYPSKPAIQVAYTDSSKSADQSLLNQVNEILNSNQILSESTGLKENNIVAKFNSFEEIISGVSCIVYEGDINDYWLNSIKHGSSCQPFYPTWIMSAYVMALIAKALNYSELVV